MGSVKGERNDWAEIDRGGTDVAGEQGSHFRPVSAVVLHSCAAGCRERAHIGDGIRPRDFP